VENKLFFPPASFHAIFKVEEEWEGELMHISVPVKNIP
jgi:hypothetical protein